MTDDTVTDDTVTDDTVTDDTVTADPVTPVLAWRDLLGGSERFATGSAAHPDQDTERRAALAGGQQPAATVFGCSDSRVPAELVLDQGLGRLFVVRTAGHVVDSGVLGSIEYGVGQLGTPLVVVLGHSSCGAVRAGIDSAASGTLPGGFVRDVVERVLPSVLAVREREGGNVASGDVEDEHVRQTVRLLLQRSAVVGDAVRDGRCAVVGLVYSLEQGRIREVERVGDLPD